MEGFERPPKPLDVRAAPALCNRLMPIVRIAFRELRRHNIAEEVVRGGARTREPLGFDLARPVSVR